MPWLHPSSWFVGFLILYHLNLGLAVVLKKDLCNRVSTKDLPLYKPGSLKPSAGFEIDTNVPAGHWSLNIAAPVDDSVGLLHWDKNYKYGSASCDLIRQNQDYTRISLSTVPRTGNHWLKDIICRYTNEGTAATWPEGGKWSDKFQCYINSRRREPPKSTIFIKDHVPFQAVLKKDNTFDPFFANNTFHIMTVRNPFDAFLSWTIFVGAVKYSRRYTPLQDYMWAWAAHYTYHNSIKSLPLYVIRYEDMVRDVQGECSNMFKALPEDTFPFDQEKVNLVTLSEKGRTKHSFMDSCGRGMLNISHPEIMFIQNNFGHMLKRYGYILKFEPEI